MIYQFGPFELHLATVELREGDKTRAMEPQVFALLALLVENRERLVSKDEIIEKVWDGRIVSDAAVTSRVKSARHALGDDGKSQRFIRTIHGQGYRFIASAKALRSTGSFHTSALAGGRRRLGHHRRGSAFGHGLQAFARRATVRSRRQRRQICSTRRRASR